MKTLVAIALIAFTALLAACSSPPKTPVQSIRVIAEPDANGNAATALDIVFVYDTAALSMLPKSGPEWFERKAALVSGLANAIEVVALQVPPAMTVDVTLPKNHAKAIGVYGFANYLSAAGQPVGNLTPFKRTTIRLTPRTVVYSGN